MIRHELVEQAQDLKTVGLGLCLKIMEVLKDTVHNQSTANFEALHLHSLILVRVIEIAAVRTHALAVIWAIS